MVGVDRVLFRRKRNTIFKHIIICNRENLFDLNDLEIFCHNMVNNVFLYMLQPLVTSAKWESHKCRLRQR